MKLIKTATCFGSVKQPSPGFISEVRYTMADDVCFTLPKHAALLFTPIKYCVGRFGQWIRNTWKVLKCGGGEGWKRSVGPIM
jgi:hypothetical protein